MEPFHAACRSPSCTLRPDTCGAQRIAQRIASHRTLSAEVEGGPGIALMRQQPAMSQKATPTGRGVSEVLGPRPVETWQRLLRLATRRDRSALSHWVE